MSKAVLKALKQALNDENQNRADLRKTADKLAKESADAEIAAKAAEAAVFELQDAIDALEAEAPTDEQVPA